MLNVHACASCLHYFCCYVGNHRVNLWLKLNMYNEIISTNYCNIVYEYFEYIIILGLFDYIEQGATAE